MKVKRILMAITSGLVLLAVLKLCDTLANLYPSPDLEGRISTPVYAKDTGIQTREYGEITRLERWTNDYISEIRTHYEIDEQVRNVSDDFPNYF